MAEETVAAAPPTGTEPVSQDTLDRATSEETVDSMLATIPGLDKYFGGPSGEEKVAKAATGKADASPAEATEPAGVTDEVLSAGQTEQESAKPEKAELPEAVQARIDRLTAARRELEDSMASLSKENTELKAKISGAGVRTGNVANPLADLVSYEALERRLIDARQAKTWALENLDGGSVEINKETGETRELSGLEVKRLLAMSEQLITEHIPKQKAYLDARTDFDRQADAYYTDLKKPESELARTLTQWVNIFPEVTRFPDFRLIIADALVGQKVRLGRLAAAKNGHLERGKAPTLAAPSPSASARVPAKSVLNKELLDRMATDRSALDVFSESLIGSNLGKAK